jgi:hypothetical protein
MSFMLTGTAPNQTQHITISPNPTGSTIMNYATSLTVAAGGSGYAFGTSTVPSIQSSKLLGLQPGRGNAEYPEGCVSRDQHRNGGW